MRAQEIALAVAVLATVAAWLLRCRAAGASPLCVLGIHRQPPGLNLTWCWTWRCTRCGRPRPGALGR